MNLLARLGSRNASYTRSAAASKRCVTRARTLSSDPVIGRLISLPLTASSLAILLLQERVERAESSLPQRSMRFDPFGRTLEWLGVELNVKNRAALLPA